MSKKRDTWILDELSKKGSIYVKDIAERYQISLESARRDLRRLSKSDLLVRTHGGAISKHKPDMGYSFNTRQELNVVQKKQLAKNAVEAVFENAIIGLDASSTSWYFAQMLPDMPCSIITNSMHNVEALSQKRHINIIATGGVFSEKYFGFYGPLAELLLDRLHIDIGIFSCVGIDDHGAIWESNELNASIKSKLMSVCDKNFLLADKSKFGKKNLIQWASLTDFDNFFTDEIANSELLKYVQEKNIIINAYSKSAPIK